MYLPLFSDDPCFLEIYTVLEKKGEINYNILWGRFITQNSIRAKFVTNPMSKPQLQPLPHPLPYSDPDPDPHFYPGRQDRDDPKKKQAISDSAGWVSPERKVQSN